MNEKKRPVKLLLFAELASTRGITFTRQHLHRLEAQKKFPRRVALGENRVGWVESEIDEYLEAKLAARAA